MRRRGYFDRGVNLSPTEIFETFTAAQGWNESSQVLVMLNYLEKLALDGDATANQFHDFLTKFVKNENESADWS